MERVHLVISGDVQGIGFRVWARRQALDLELTGWVKNRSDGAVEIVAEGPRAKLRQLVSACQTGPEVAWVEKVDIDRSKATGEYFSFEVVY